MKRKIKKLKELENPLPMYEWSRLQEKGKYIVDDIKKKWNKLLITKHNEEVYQSYISEHAGFFFGNLSECYFSISKLKLSNEFITDFVNAFDGHSNGINYNFIEIEIPHRSPFLKNGNPSARLTGAIQQILNWKNWIANHRTEIRDILPSVGHRVYKNPNITFTIFIGNRKNSEKWLERRIELSKEINISIRSFDYLTDLLERRFIHNYVWTLSAELNELHESILNGLANPFYKSYSDKAWRNILLEMNHYSHFTAHNSEILLNNRRYNKSFDKFLKVYEKLK